MSRCPACGNDNPDGFRFCGSCGVALAATPRVPSTERRVVTALFCDLVGFTASSDGADPEDVLARLRPYYARLRSEIERFGGVVQKFIGDAVVGVFGAPVAHEDDPERAVRAGLRIIEAIEDLNAEDPSRQLSVRVGITTGEAIVTRSGSEIEGEGSVQGDVMNMASRLQSAAPVGGVVVGEPTYRATREIFDYEALEPAIVKGKAEPLGIHRALAPRARLGTDITRSLTTPLVGRDLERDLLFGTFSRTLREASVHQVTIVGEPGVGKSRLVAELLSFVDATPGALVSWRQGRCLPYGEGITFWALGEIVKAQAGILETDPPDVAGTKIDDAVPEDHPDAAWLRQRLRPLVGLDAPEAARQENFAAWRAFLESIAERDPAVFVFEDLHWADDALLAFLEHLIDYAEAVPMLVVATARPELFDKAPTWASAARNLQRINLSPLTGEDTARLISNLLDQAVLPAEVQAAILERSGGNPLFAQEFVRLLKDAGILTKRGQTWRIEPGAGIPLPDGIQTLIAARLDTLSPAHKRLLADASVIGTVFWSGALAVMEGIDGEEIRTAMHELSRKDLVIRAGRSSMEGEYEYAFSHVLVRDVAYAQIPRADRADKHIKAAAWIEAVAESRVDDHAEILAAHYISALELATAAKRSDTDELESNAVRYLTLAGDRAMRIDVEAAERHYAEAIQLAREYHPERTELLARHAEALRQRGRYREAADAYEGAIAGFESRGDVAAEAVAMANYTLLLEAIGDSRYGEMARRSAALLESLGPSPALVSVLTELAGTTFPSHGFDQKIAEADRAIALADELGLPTPARALGFRGIARALQGDVGGLDDMRTAKQAAIAQGMRRDVALLYANLSSALGLFEGPRPGLGDLTTGRDVAERHGIVDLALALTAASAAFLVDLGSYDEAENIANDLDVQLERVGDVEKLVSLRSSRIRILARRGRYAQAEPLADWTIDNARTLPPQELSQAFQSVAELWAASDRVMGACRLLAELAETPDICNEPSFGAELPVMIRTALSAGDDILAARLLEDVEPRLPLIDLALTSARALLAEHRGGHLEATTLFSDASERWRAFEIPWERAHALVGEGRCLIALGRLREAAGSLEQARKIFASLRAAPALADVDGLLATA